MTLDEAFKFFDDFCLAFGDYFSVKAVAGSVRRGEPEVKDLEVVAILPDENREAFIHAIDTHNFYQCLKPATPERIPWPIKKDGKYWKFVHGENVRFGPQEGERKLDLFLATPENFGWIYLIRTGPAEFSQFCAGRWKDVGPRNQNGDKAFSKDGFLCTGAGVRVPTPSEEAAFRALRMAVIPPHLRKQAANVPTENRSLSEAHRNPT